MKRGLPLSHKELLAFVFAVALLCAAFSYAGSSRAPIASSETRFVEYSKSGLRLVPASCPSSPDYNGGSCSGPGTQDPYTVTCGFWASAYTIQQGQQTTLSWSSPGLLSASISGVGTFTSAGSAAVSPSQTTNYTATVYNYGVAFAATCDLTITVVPQSTQQPPQSCPQGQVLQGGVCVTPPPQSCPQGQILQGGVCVTPAPQCTAQFYCVGNDLWQRSTQCVESLNQACSWGCSGGGCLPAPPGSGTITASPALIKSAETSVITWSAQNVQAGSCTVTENNPDITDSWTGSSGTRTSSEIRMQTSYTLRCTGHDGVVFTDSAKVNVIPVFEEQ